MVFGIDVSAMFADYAQGSQRVAEALHKLGGRGDNMSGLLADYAQGLQLVLEALQALYQSGQQVILSFYSYSAAFLLVMVLAVLATLCDLGQTVAVMLYRKTWSEHFAPSLCVLGALSCTVMANITNNECPAVDLPIAVAVLLWLNTRCQKEDVVWRFAVMAVTILSLLITLGAGLFATPTGISLSRAGLLGVREGACANSCARLFFWHAGRPRV